MDYKTPYKTPEVEFIKLTDDIITVSLGNGIDEDFGPNDGEWL